MASELRNWNMLKVSEQLMFNKQNYYHHHIIGLFF